MQTLNEEKEFVNYIVELMQSIGSVQAKKMFGGYGLFLDGLMFALIADSVLYLKADRQTVADFEAKGLEAFTYYKKNKPVRLSYYQAPEDILENHEEMIPWANKAYQVALKAAAKK